MKNLYLDWTKVEKVAPAGYAILACLNDWCIEHRFNMKHVRIKKKFKENRIIKQLTQYPRPTALPEPSSYSFDNDEVILSGNRDVLNMQFVDKMKTRFIGQLNGDLEFSASLVLNELMVNSVDHSTAERYFLYAGTWNNEFHIGALDMGITIPAKLERKYKASDDVHYLDMALKEGVSTRRQRLGGFGLFYAFEHLKTSRGKLTILSREAQIR